MNRLWVVESALTTTGAMADHRLALPSGRIGAFALALAADARGARVSPSACRPASRRAPAGVPTRWLEALAKDLAANAAAAWSSPGRDQPPAVHALALALNAALGNVGTTRRSCASRSTAAVADRRSSPSWSTAMRAGAVSTLVVLGGNPVYDAPADLDFAAALGQGRERRPPRRSRSTRPPSARTGTCPRRTSSRPGATPRRGRHARASCSR